MRCFMWISSRLITIIDMDVRGRIPFSWRARARSFRYAFAGMITLFRQEHNVRIHCVAAVCAVIAGCLCRISALKWCMVVGCIGAVLMAEAFNSAIEAVCDKVSPEYSVFIKKAKDVAAAAVLFVAIASVIIGCVIFVPAIYDLANE